VKVSKNKKTPHEATPKSTTGLFHINHFALSAAPIEADLAYIAEGNDSLLDGVHRIVFRETSVFASYEVSAALADNDRAFLCFFTSVEFHPEVLRV